MSVEGSLCRLPDVTSDALPDRAGRLEWVGMQAIEMAVLLPAPEGPVRVPARVDAFVDLADPQARGIHMSRLYRLLDQRLARETLTPRTLHALLRDFLASHEALSTRALLRLRCDWLVQRPALRSEGAGWRRYPLALSASHDRQHFQMELAVELLYSSTCPCSAALARQLNQQRFAAEIAAQGLVEASRVLAWLGSERGLAGTPHGQRSRAQLRLRLLPGFGELPLAEVIDAAEGALGTPVQTVVRREDEQAFAALNADNLMFCEDAARRLRGALDADARIADWWLRVIHEESLHPHDAVAVACKGLPGGYDGGSGWVEGLPG